MAQINMGVWLSAKIASKILTEAEIFYCKKSRSSAYPYGPRSVSNPE